QQWKGETLKIRGCYITYVRLVEGAYTKPFFVSRYLSIISKRLLFGIQFRELNCKGGYFAHSKEISSSKYGSPDLNNRESMIIGNTNVDEAKQEDSPLYEEGTVLVEMKK
ncbi:11001_t:CDS:2, partial [Funneliformis mosseae]